MNHERDYLVNYIFPQIDDYCRHRALEFIPIDLRWGITEEESRNASVLNSCLVEVNNCRPYFIGIIGDRYGWSPNIDELENLGLELMKEQDWLLEKVAEGASITEMEIDYGVLRDRRIKHAAFFIRQNDSISKEMREIPGSDQEKKLKALKEKIRKQVKYPVFDYNDVEYFGKTLKKLLIDMINSEYPPTSLDAEDAVLAPHEHTLRRLAENACEVPDVTGYLDKWSEDLHKLLIVVGESGSGKSSVIAHFVNQIRDKYVYTDIKILYFNFESLPAGENPTDAFQNYMSLKRTEINPDEWSLVAIDNIGNLNQEEIEQLSDWVSRQSINTHIILGVTQGTMAYDCIYFRFQCPRITFGGYSRELIAHFATVYLKRFGKKLNQEQLDIIIGEPKLRNALKLRMALDAIISHGNFETLDTRINEVIKDSKTDYLFSSLIQYFAHVYTETGLITEFAEASIAVSLSSFGISEKDIMAALKLNQTKWSAIRPAILRFCKGSTDSLRLASESWQYELKMYWSTPLRASVGKRVSDYLLSNSKRKIKYAQTIAAIYNDIWHLPFDDNGSSNTPLFLEYQESIKDFATSFDAVMNVDPGLLSSMVLGINKKEETLKFDNLEAKTIEEKTQYYYRLATMLSGFNKNSMASNCYNKLADTLDSEGSNIQASFFRSLALLEKGKAKDALQQLTDSGLLKTGWPKSFSIKFKRKEEPSLELRLKAMALEIRILALTRKLKKLKNKLNSLIEECDKVDVESLSKECIGDILLGIALAVRCLLMFNLWSDYPENSAIQILDKYDRKIRQFGLCSEAAYEFSFARSIIALYKEDYENLAYWAYYCLKSAGIMYGAHTNNVLILFNNRSYQYCRASNLYAIAFWHINKVYYDWHGRGFKQNFYESLPDFRTLDGADLTKFMEVDLEIKHTADFERMWFIKAIKSIQPEYKQLEMEKDLDRLKNDSFLFGMSKSINNATKWYKYFFE